MLDQLVREPPLIDGYVLVERQRIPIRRVALIGLLSSPFWLALFLSVSRFFGGTTHLSLDITFLGVFVAILNLTLVMPVVHEAVHGLVARLFGARPTYGIGAGFAYTTFREPVRPIPYLLIGLAPLVVISSVGVALLVVWPFAPGQMLVFLVGNGAGSFGDLWVAAKVLQLPRECMISDLADGFAFYLPTTKPVST